MSPDALNSLFSLCIGFSLAGALASGYQAFAERPAGFGLLQEGVTPRHASRINLSLRMMWRPAGNSAKQGEWPVAWWKCRCRSIP